MIHKSFGNHLEELRRRRRQGDPLVEREMQRENGPLLRRIVRRVLDRREGGSPVEDGLLREAEELRALSLGEDAVVECLTRRLGRALLSARPLFARQMGPARTVMPAGTVVGAEV